MYLVYESDCKNMYENHIGSLIFMSNNHEGVIKFLKKKKVNHGWKHHDGTFHFQAIVSREPWAEGMMLKDDITYIVKKGMKDINYGDVHQGLLGIEDLGDGYKLAVVNVGGTHHCAYVQFPGVESIGSYNDIHVDAHVHGGFTFLGSLSNYELDGIWLGWDYAHFGDYMFRSYRSCMPEEKMWTTTEVVMEGLDILKAIKDGKWRKENKDAIH